MPKATCGDMKLYYETAGSGRPVLLIAGAASDHDTWLGVMRALAARYRVIAFDNRGCGKSGSPGTPYSIRQMAEDTRRLLDRLGVARTHVVGHSMGGYIAQELAIRHPDRIDKLVLEATAQVASARTMAVLRDLLAGRARARGAGLESWMRQWALWLFSPQTFGRRSFIETFVKNAAAHPLPQPLVGFRRQVDAIAAFDTTGRLRRIRARTLVITGEDDILIPLHESAVLAREIPGSRSVTLRGAGHCMHLEDPAAFTKAVMGFLGEKGRR